MPRKNKSALLDEAMKTRFPRRSYSIASVSGATILKAEGTMTEDEINDLCRTIEAGMVEILTAVKFT